MHRESLTCRKYGMLLTLLLLGAATSSLPTAHGQQPSLQDDLTRLQGSWNIAMPNTGRVQHGFTFQKNKLETWRSHFSAGELLTMRHAVTIELQQDGKKRRVAAANKSDSFTPWTYRFDGKSLIIEDGNFQGEWLRVAPAQPAPTLELRLTARKLVYTLDLGGKTPEEYLRPFSALKLKPQDAIPFAVVGKLPPCPHVDLVLEIRNTGKQAIDLWSGTTPTLDIEGPGIHRFRCETGRHVIPLPFEQPTKFTLAPGKSHSMRIEQLMLPVTAVSLEVNRYYWTHPGEYTVKATWPLATSANKHGEPVLVSNTVKLRVAPAKISPARLKGLTDAVVDIEKGFLKLKEYPLPAPPWYPDYLDLLKKEYGVDFVGVTFEEVMQDAFHPRAEIDGYNGVMQVEIEHRFGQGILGKLKERARGKNVDPGQLKQTKLDPVRLQAMKAALANLTKGSLKLKVLPPEFGLVQAPPWYEDYVQRARVECGIEFVYENLVAMKVEAGGYNGLLLLEIEHRFGQGILNNLYEAAQSHYQNNQVRDKANPVVPK